MCIFSDILLVTFLSLFLFKVNHLGYSSSNLVMYFQFVILVLLLISIVKVTFQMELFI